MSHNSHHRDRIIKNIGAIFLSIIVLSLVLTLSGGNGFNNHLGYGINGLVVALIKMLFLLTVIGIVAGLFSSAHKQSLLHKIFEEDHHRRHFCHHCGQEIEKGWKHCPACGLPVKKESKKDKHKHPDVIEEIEPAQGQDDSLTGPSELGAEWPFKVEDDAKTEKEIKQTAPPVKKDAAKDDAKKKQDKPKPSQSETKKKPKSVKKKG